MRRTVRGKRESNSQSAPLSHLYMCVDLLFQREKSVTVSASDCFSTSIELDRKNEGFVVFFFFFFNFHKSLCILLFVIRIPNFSKEHNLGLSEDHYCMAVCKQLSSTDSSEWWRTAKWFLLISLSSFCLFKINYYELAWLLFCFPKYILTFNLNFVLLWTFNGKASLYTMVYLHKKCQKYMTAQALSYPSLQHTQSNMPACRTLSDI